MLVCYMLSHCTIMRLEGVLLAAHRVLRAPVEVALHQGVGLAPHGHLARRGTLGVEHHSVAIVDELDGLARPGDADRRPANYRYSMYGSKHGYLNEALMSTVNTIIKRGEGTVD